MSGASGFRVLRILVLITGIKYCVRYWPRIAVDVAYSYATVQRAGSFCSLLWSSVPPAHGPASAGAEERISPHRVRHAVSTRMRRRVAKARHWTARGGQGITLSYVLLRAGGSLLFQAKI